MKTTIYNSEKKIYQSPCLIAITIDSQISLQLQTHEKGTPPEEPTDWVKQSNQSMYW